MCTQLFIILLAIEQSVFWGGGVEQALKGHSRDDFAVFWGKKKNIFANMKLLSEHQEKRSRDFSEEEL